METIYHCFIIETSVETVFAAVSSVNGVANWWTTSVSGEYEEKGILRFGFGPLHQVEVEILKIILNEYVEWICRDGPPDWKGTVLNFTLEKNEEGVMVRFRHIGWEQVNDFFGECNFHWAHFMRSLKLYCEKGQGAPYLVS